MNWCCAPSAEVLHRHLDHALLGGSAYFRVITGGACLVMIPQVRVLRAALWRSLSSEGVPLRCGLQTWGLLCEVCVVLCSGRGRDTVSLVTRGNSVFVAANRVLKRGQSRNDVVFRKTLCCEARPHLPDKKDKAGRERGTCWRPPQHLKPPCTLRDCADAKSAELGAQSFQTLPSTSMLPYIARFSYG